MILPGSRSHQHLLLRSAWHYALQHPWQTWLSFLGIALGVMMVVAVDLANSSAARSFDLSVATINGSITHQISGGSSGVPDSMFTRLRTELALRRSAPALSGTVRVQGQSMTLLGLDFFSELALQRNRAGFNGSQRGQLQQALGAMQQRNAVLMHAATAANLGLTLDEPFTLRGQAGQHEVVVVATLEGEEVTGSEQVLFTDIATAQLILGKTGILDSIDLILTQQQAEDLRSALPASLSLVDASTRNTSVQQMTRAFHTNLLAMSLLALLVAALLIYNTVSLSVVQRQPALGVLRSLGVTRAELVKLVLLEVLLLGFAASIVGVVLGLGLGQLLVKLVTRTVDDLYFNLTVTRFLLDPLVLAKGLAWGVGISLLAAALPAWQAGLAPPITLQQRAGDDSHWMRRLPYVAFAGALLMSLGYLLLQIEQGGLVLGFVALNCIIFGFCLVVPLLVSWSLTVVLRVLHTRLRQTVRLALRNLQVAITRTGLAVAALTVAVSVTVGVGVMVGSFRDTVILWLEQTLTGDVQITRLDGDGIAASLSNELLSLPEVQALHSQYQLQVESNIGALTVLAEAGSAADHLYLKELSAQGLQQVDRGEALMVAEPLAWQANVQIGDEIELYTANGRVVLPVAGVFYDYTTTGGLVSMSAELFTRLWPDAQPARLILETRDDTDLSAFAAQMRQRVATLEGNYGVAANADIRNITLNIFDRTFAITHVLRLLAILVAFVGILSALITLQLQRLREYAMLRATGMTVRETGTIILVQTSVMGLIAGLLALPLGLMMSDILIDVINRRSFGWSMQHILPPMVFVQALLLAMVAALLAGFYPMKQVARVNPAEAMRQE